ncbi:MAG: hypothetical protein LC799_07445, partial [Actinobacteria bacterium]|nr:hypothetical protein [Actinomycetota bacterium]
MLLRLRVEVVSAGGTSGHALGGDVATKPNAGVGLEDRQNSGPGARPTTGRLTGGTTNSAGVTDFHSLRGADTNGADQRVGAAPTAPSVAWPQLGRAGPSEGDVSATT